MEMKLFDSERKVMEVLWENGHLPAARIADILGERIGWNKNTTYTVIKKCIEKGAIRREDPKFICYPVLTKAEARHYEAREMIDRLFDGSTKNLLASIFEGKAISEKEARELKELIDHLEKENQ